MLAQRSKQADGYPPTPPRSAAAYVLERRWCLMTRMPSMSRREKPRMGSVTDLAGTTVTDEDELESRGRHCVWMGA